MRLCLLVCCRGRCPSSSRNYMFYAHAVKMYTGGMGKLFNLGCKKFVQTVRFERTTCTRYTSERKRAVWANLFNRHGLCVGRLPCTACSLRRVRSRLARKTPQIPPAPLIRQIFLTLQTGFGRILCLFRRRLS